MMEFARTRLAHLRQADYGSDERRRCRERSCQAAPHVGFGAEDSEFGPKLETLKEMWGNPPPRVLDSRTTASQY